MTGKPQLLPMNGVVMPWVKLVSPVPAAVTVHSQPIDGPEPYVLVAALTKAGQEASGNHVGLPA